MANYILAMWSGDLSANLLTPVASMLEQSKQ